MGKGIKVMIKEELFRHEIMPGLFPEFCTGIIYSNNRRR
jgi:hypothetical protein